MLVVAPNAGVVVEPNVELLPKVEPDPPNVVLLVAGLVVAPKVEVVEGLPNKPPVEAAGVPNVEPELCPNSPPPVLVVLAVEPPNGELVCVLPNVFVAGVEPNAGVVLVVLAPKAGVVVDELPKSPPPPDVVEDPKVLPVPPNPVLEVLPKVDVVCGVDEEPNRPVLGVEPKVDVPVLGVEPNADAGCAEPKAPPVFCVDPKVDVAGVAPKVDVLEVVPNPPVPAEGLDCVCKSLKRSSSKEMLGKRGLARKWEMFWIVYMRKIKNPLSSKGAYLGKHV